MENSNINCELENINYYDEIKKNLIKCEIYDNSKEYQKNRNKVITYFKNGKLLYEVGSVYGKNVIKQYSKKIMEEVDKKYNERTLYRMRKFYEIFQDEKLTPLVTKLSWSHYVQLLSIKNSDEIIYYINISIINNLNKRELQELIKSNEYGRLSNKIKNKLIKLDNLRVNDFVPNPMIIKSNYLNEEMNEYALKQAILNNIDNFLRQLGIVICKKENKFVIEHCSYEGIIAGEYEIV